MTCSRRTTTCLICGARDHDNAELLWAALNSTVAALSKHQFGRAAGVEGNLKTEVVDVNMMLVPDIRRASPEAAARAIAACERMTGRDARRHLYEEFTLDDRRELDDATFEILGIEDSGERAAAEGQALPRTSLIYRRAVKEREVIAQRDRGNANRRGALTPQDIAERSVVRARVQPQFTPVPGGFLSPVSTKGTLSICRRARLKPVRR